MSRPQIELINPNGHTEKFDATGLTVRFELNGSYVDVKFMNFMAAGSKLVFMSNDRMAIEHEPTACTTLATMALAEWRAPDITNAARRNGKSKRVASIIEDALIDFIGGETDDGH